MRPSHCSLFTVHGSPFVFPFLLATLVLGACEMRLQIPSQSNALDISAYQFEATGEDFLISALDEVQAIADWTESFQSGLSSRLSELTTAGTKALLKVTSTDTIYIYGQVIPGGYGAVVTERYARPKGLLLITVRKTYGKGNGHVVTETKRYASAADHLSDNPQQTNVTEMYGTQSDTIVTHVLRNGTLQTYTFRLPVVTRVVNPQDGSIRITSRYASNGKILSRVTDGEGNLVQLRSSYGQSDGSTVTRTEYLDGSWSQVRTHGEADGTVTRETTSGLPTLGSGNPGAPTNILRLGPPIYGRDNLLFLASGLCMPGNMPKPKLAARVIRSSHDAQCMISQLPLLASGVIGSCPKPPIPRMGLIPCRTDGGQPPPAPGVASTSTKQSIASGMTMTPLPPRPILT